MKKLFVMAAMVLSSVGAFAQYNAGDVTIQPKVGLNVSSLTEDDAEYKAVEVYPGLSGSACRYRSQRNEYQSNPRFPLSLLQDEQPACELSWYHLSAQESLICSHLSVRDSVR